MSGRSVWEAGGEWTVGWYFSGGLVGAAFMDIRRGVVAVPVLLSLGPCGLN